MSNNWWNVEKCHVYYSNDDFVVIHFLDSKEEEMAILKLSINETQTFIKLLKNAIRDYNNDYNEGSF